MNLFLLLLCTVTMLLSVHAATSGVARIMPFKSELTKRGLRGTWYSGEDLNNAACYGRNGLSPYSATIHSMIGAMAMDEFENCYKCMKITNDDNKDLTVVVKIVDKCAGCIVNEAIDLTPAAFKKLAPGGDLNVGVLNITWKQVKCTESDLYPSLPKD